MRHRLRGYPTMIAMVAMPAAITLRTVRTSTLAGAPPVNGSPHGYTVSLSCSLAPDRGLAAAA